MTICPKGVVCMASRSRAGRLALLANMLVFTSLNLPYRGPRIDSPGEGEEEGGTGLYCPFCDRPLLRREDEEGALFCVLDGPIDEDEALRSPSKPRS